MLTIDQWHHFIPYALLMVAIALQWHNSKNIMWGALLIALVTGFMLDAVTILGLLGLFSFGLSCFLFFHTQIQQKFLAPRFNHRQCLYSFLAMVCSLTIIVIFKKSLFHSFDAFSDLYISAKSIPYSMHFDFGTTFSMIVLWMGQAWLNAKPSEKPGQSTRSGFFIFFCILPLVIGITAAASLMAGYIQWDLKWGYHLGPWIIHNVFFVCVPDEIFFRFFLQSQFRQFLPPQGLQYRLHIAIPAVAFGIAHGSSIFYVIFASILGGFYGYVYEKSNKISWSILVHFLFNLCHILFFTYPASIAILKSIR